MNIEVRQKDECQEEKPVMAVMLEDGGFGYAEALFYLGRPLKTWKPVKE